MSDTLGHPPVCRRCPCFRFPPSRCRCCGTTRRLAVSVLISASFLRSVELVQLRVCGGDSFMIANMMMMRSTGRRSTRNPSRASPEFVFPRLTLTAIIDFNNPQVEVLLQMRYGNAGLGKATYTYTYVHICVHVSISPRWPQ